MKRLDALFEVTYGSKFDLNKMKLSTYANGGVNFVGRSSQNHGVSAIVEHVYGIQPFEKGLITVALGGTKLLSSFVQSAPFYTAQNVAVLRPLKKMSFQEKLFACICIRHNRFRYSAFGREGNRTLKTLLLPSIEDFPDWLKNLDVESADSLKKPKESNSNLKLDTNSWCSFKLDNLFDIKKGKRLTKASMLPGNTPFIGATDSNNGLTARIGQNAIHEANTISLSYNGSVAEAFYQAEPFWASDDVNVLYPKFELSASKALFLCAILKREKYRFNYGRKWHTERMVESYIKLPSHDGILPDWDYIERFVNSLEYSSQI